MRQAALLPTIEHSPPSISGLQYVPDYISAARETSLMGMIDAQPWLSDLKRRVPHYGYS